jgi:penicillin-insensitive murein DD-endopeptidase
VTMSGEVRRPLGVPIEPDGHGTDFGDLLDPADDIDMRLDVPRTWRLVQALVEDQDALVQRIFLVEHVRATLLAHAEATHAPRAAIDRFAEVTCQPGVPHDDHLHVRFFCSPEDLGLGCEDSPPIYPWRNRALAALGVNEVLASAYTTPVERRAKKQRTSSPAQARKRAGQMHPRVTAFLDAREAWLPRPHPGRPYCR